MGDAYDRALVELRREIDSGGARPKAIDAAIVVLLPVADDRLPSDLLSLLSDVAEYGEGMFSLIHTAESCEDSAYVRALFAVLVALKTRAPSWASTVLTRALNSASARAEMVAQLPAASVATKQVVREMCERIDASRPELSSKTSPVILAACR